MEAGKKVVLMADDDEDDRLFLTEALLKVDPDLDVIEVESGLELVDILHNRKYPKEPSLIVVDMNMPKMNGLETMEALKRESDSGDIPAVMLSTSSDKVTSGRALQAGFREYFIKPQMFQGFLTLASRLKTKYLG